MASRSSLIGATAHHSMVKFSAGEYPERKKNLGLMMVTPSRDVMKAELFEFHERTIADCWWTRLADGL